MDDRRFDATAKAIGNLSSRRQALRVAGVGGVSATLGVLGWRDAEAKKRKKNKKKNNKKKRCKKFVESCSGDSACCSGQCCHFVDPVDQFCILSRDVEVCCTDLGVCDADHPNCCYLGDGGCCSESSPVCCYDDLFGGYCCPPDTECCDTDPTGCCATEPLRSAVSQGGRQAHTMIRQQPMRRRR